MPTLEGVGRRVRQCQLTLASQIGEKVSNAEFGRRVAEAEEPPREEPYSEPLVTAWFNERTEPTRRAYFAMAKLVGWHPSVIPFGDAPESREEPKNYRRLEDVVAEQEVRKVAERPIERPSHKPLTRRKGA